MCSTEPAAAPRTRRRWSDAARGAWVLAILGAAPLAAQGRSATIRVNVTVREFAESDVLGVRESSTVGSDGIASGAREDAGWRIMGGRGPEMALHVESEPAGPSDAPVPSVAVCEIVARGVTGDCRLPQRSHLTVRVGGTHPDYLVRLERAGRAPARPVRVTLAYVGM